MQRAERERIAGRPAPTEAERKLAARIRVRADKARKAQTPEWIKALAQAS